MSGIISIFLNYSGDQEVLFNFDVISKKLSPSSNGSSLDPDYLDKQKQYDKRKQCRTKIIIVFTCSGGFGAPHVHRSSAQIPVSEDGGVGRMEKRHGFQIGLFYGVKCQNIKLMLIIFPKRKKGRIIRHFSFHFISIPVQINSRQLNDVKFSCDL